MFGYIYSLVPYRRPHSKLIFQKFPSQAVLIPYLPPPPPRATGYKIMKISSNTSFQDIYSFCIDNIKTILLKNKKNFIKFSGILQRLLVYSNPLLIRFCGFFQAFGLFQSHLLLGTKEQVYYFKQISSCIFKLSVKTF